MSVFSSLLFTSHRKPSVASAIDRPDDILHRGVAFHGGTLMVKGGLQIDATLDEVTVVSTDGRPVVLTALGKMSGCHIHAQDILIMGDFTGELSAAGDVEVTDSARFAGSIRAGGHVLLSPLAAGAGEVTVTKYVPPADVVGIDQITEVIENSGFNAGDASQSGN
jgi:cytoskeletal protein CcmA (bactofilin family)